MNIPALKSFAVRARTDLLAEMDARLTQVTAEGSLARLDSPETVKELEKAVRSQGREQVVERAAYTWFNRLIALRFMDANGYTGILVVSPADGAAAGQPEILSAAKRGEFNDKVVRPPQQKRVLALLDGAVPSPDPQGEAFTILLLEACRHWNQAMPFMFEVEGESSELLVPATLLADTSVMAQAVEVLDDRTCRDVEVIGWLYQFYVSARKDEVYAGFKAGRKAGAAEIPPATQLFTPHWIVRYLVENSVGRLWMLNHPESSLTERMSYYVPPQEEETDFLQVTSPEDLTVMDPACGSGHMLTYAFDLLYAIYEEEGYSPVDIPELILSRNLRGLEIDPRAGALASFALTMKARKRQRTFLRKKITPRICVLEPVRLTDDELERLLDDVPHRDEVKAFWRSFENADVLGSLIQVSQEQAVQAEASVTGQPATWDEAMGKTWDHLLADDTILLARKILRQASYLTSTYAVVVANPPYMGAKNMNSTLAAYVGDRFPHSKADLYATFIERCMSLTQHAGQTAMITMQSWMFLKSFADLRKSLLTSVRLNSLLHLPYGREGTKTMGIAFGTCAFVINKSATSTTPTYFQAFLPENATPSLEPSSWPIINKHNSQIVQSEFSTVPGCPIIYWMPNPMRRAFIEDVQLSRIAAPRQGLATADNNRFVRQWWEVSRSRTDFHCSSRDEASRSRAHWFPFNKGGDYRKWYGNQEHVVDWENDGLAIRNFKTDRTGKTRSLPQNIDTYFLPHISWSNISTGSAGFRTYPCGFIYSHTGDAIISADKDTCSYVSTLNSKVVDTFLHAIAPTLHFEVGQVGAIPTRLDHSEATRNRVEQLITTSRADWDSFETSWDFTGPEITAQTASQPLCSQVASLLERWVARSVEQQRLEAENNEAVARLYGLEDEIPTAVPLEQVSLTRNTAFTYQGKSAERQRALAERGLLSELLSYAVGCIMGRYSLDAPGLVLGDGGSTLDDYLAKVPSPSFAPDADGILPIVDGDWFDDDVVTRFREFLTTAFGADHLEENLRYIRETLGLSSIRDYFIKPGRGGRIAKSPFYEDHVKRYRNRPVYWMFSSPQGSFNVLIYLHRYTPTTVSRILNDYLREYQAKLRATLDHLMADPAHAKEADRLRHLLVELRDYEHDVLYPLATRNVEIDLDDGVLVNYLRLGKALRPVRAIEKKRAAVRTWTWPHHPLTEA